MAFDAEAYLNYFGFKRIKPSGHNIQASCPDFDGIHERGDIRPSFGIHYRTGVSHCFMCGLALSLEQLTAKLLSRELDKNVDEYQAWLWLEEKGRTPQQLSVDEVKDNINFLGHEEKVEYLDDEALEEFHYGIHPSVVYDIGINPEAAKEWELRYDKMTQRTIIPARTEEGHLLGFLSRAVDNDAYIKHAVGIPQGREADEPIKYQFRKKLLLFGEHKFAGKDSILIVESPLDIIYAWGFGLNDEFDMGALMGTKCSEIQMERILRYNKIILALDNDKWGKRAQKQLIEKLRGKVKLYTFDHFGYKDLGEIEPEYLPDVPKNVKNVTKNILSGLKQKVN